jgi:hypothetical protein
MLAAAVVLVAAASCSPGAAAPPRALSRNGVTVTLSFRPASPATQAGADAGQLLATFRPDKPGFHLYSKDLPQSGIAGVGYPIRARPASGLVLTGIPAANVDPVPLNLPSIGLTLPVYPDGPVTLIEPVRRLSRAAGDAKILVSYAACSRTLCLQPVVNQSVAVALAQA